MLKDDIQKAINTSLPSFVGEELRAELSRLYAIEEKSKTDKDKIVKQDEELKTLREFKKKADSEDELMASGWRSLKEAQDLLKKGQEELKSSILEAKLFAAEQSNAKLFELGQLPPSNFVR